MDICLGIIVILSKGVTVKKRLFFCLIGCLFFLNDAFCDPYYLSENKNVSPAAATAWGNPYMDTTYIQDADRAPLGFKIKQGYACCTNMSYDQVANIRGDARTEDRIITTKDDVAIMVFVARKIYEHGGQFCLTQLSAVSSPSGLSIINQQPNWPQMPCMVLCQPGYDGPTCSKEVKEGTTGNDTPCNTDDIAAYISKVKQRVYENSDSITLHKWRMGVADDMEYFARDKMSGRYEHVIYLGATDFMQHGVVAQPMLVSSVGSQIPTSLKSGPAISGISKVLCAQGFTKNDKCEINSKNCGSNVWCNGYSDSNFKSNIHNKQMKDSCNIIVCKDRSKALDANFNCVDYNGFNTGLCEKEDVYEEGGLVSLYGKLVKCEEGYVFEASTCECNKASYVISKDLMQYGPRGRNTEMINEQCWTKESSEDFKDCVLGAR